MTLKHSMKLKNIGKKMEDSISEYFDRENLDDPTKILIGNIF